MVRSSFAVLLLAVCAAVGAQPCPIAQPTLINDCTIPPGVTVVPFTSDTGPQRVRKSAFTLTEPERKQLRAAWAALQALPESDPRSWYAQGKVHCWFCGGGADSAQGQEIHFSYHFFPWHRAYLYFLEKILGSLVNDPTFALPYWDWDVPGRNVVPPLYAEPATLVNPLWDQWRAAQKGDEIPAADVGPATMEQVMGAATWETFMGSPTPVPSTNANNGGSVETGPHGNVHLWTGYPPQPSNPNNGVISCSDMGVLATAAFDPIFFAHHANIDRLWDVWINTPAQPPHTNPSTIFGQLDPLWANQVFYFYDENKAYRSIKISDVVSDSGQLHYTYADGRSCCGPIPPAQASKAITPMTTEALTVTAGTRKKDMTPRTLYRLHVNGVRFQEGVAAKVRVFIEFPAATPATPTSDPHYLGYFTIVPHTRPGMAGSHHHAATEGTRNFAFDLLPEQAALVKDPANVRVTLVPVGADARNKPPRAAIEGVSEIYLESITVNR